MKIQTFKNMKGLIYGNDPKRICCDIDGILKIGSMEIKVSTNSVMPTLFHGATGDYDASFTDINGNVYTLQRVTVRGGIISPPSQTDVEIMDLRCRLDEKDVECKRLERKVRELENIFDTNSLNFLISGGETK